MQKIIRLDLGGVNCYLIENKGNYILVDTGGHMFMDRTYDNREYLLKDKLRENGVTKDNLKLVILTHGDCDHAFNALSIHKEYGVPIAMNREDVYMVDSPEWDCYKNNSKYTSLMFRIVVKFIDKKLEALMHKVYEDFSSFEPEILLEDGTELNQYGFDGIVYHTPGHTIGSICILDSEGNLICGDMFADNNKPSLAPNASDFNMLRKQAERMYALSVKMIYPGHGEPFKAQTYKL